MRFRHSVLWSRKQVSSWGLKKKKQCYDCNINIWHTVFFIFDTFLAFNRVCGSLKSAFVLKQWICLVFESFVKSAQMVNMTVPFSVKLAGMCVRACVCLWLCVCTYVCMCVRLCMCLCVFMSGLVCVCVCGWVGGYMCDDMKLEWLYIMRHNIHLLFISKEQRSRKPQIDGLSCAGGSNDVMFGTVKECQHLRYVVFFEWSLWFINLA